MSGNVVKLQPVTVGENFRFEADEILEKAKGKGFGRMVVIGDFDDGSIYVAGTANAGESMVLLERARHFLVFGERGE